MSICHRYVCDHCRKRVRTRSGASARAVPRGWSRVDDESNGTTHHACSLRCLAAFLELRQASEVSVRCSGVAS